MTRPSLYHDGICHRLAVDLFGAFEGAELEILCWQPAHTVQAVDNLRRTQIPHPFYVYRRVVFNPAGNFPGGFRVGQRQAEGTAAGNRLEVFGTHHGSHARSTGGRIQVVHDAGEAHQVFPGGPDLGNLDIRVGQFLADGNLALQGLHSPEVTGVFQRRLPVLDGNIDRLFRPAFDDYSIETGHFQLGSPVAARIGLTKSPGQR